MSGEDLPRVLFYGLLLVAVGGSLLVQMRGRMGQAAQYMAIWGLIFLGVIGAIGVWPDIRDTLSPRQEVIGSSVTVPVDADGHYRLTLVINGEPVTFFVDTGASGMVLSEADARRVGVDPAGLAYVGQAMTANGTVATAQVWLDQVTLGDVTDRDVPAWVTDGEMDASLLGMTYLSQFARVEIADGVLTLTR